MRTVTAAISICAVLGMFSGIRAQANIAGVWTGAGYSCADGGGPRRMGITIRQTGASLTADISIETSAGSGQRVSYAMTGTFDAASGRFTLRSAKPALQLAGTFEMRGDRIEGTGEPGCAFIANFRERAATPPAPAAPPAPSTPTQSPLSTGQSASALAALDAIGEKEWLTTPSTALLERVIAASSKAALEAAATTDARAQALVGSGYFFGIGGYPRNDAEAAKFYRLGARSNVIAQTNLGQMLLDGRANNGKPAPDLAAAAWKLAAAQGHRAAQYNLGTLYRDGNGVAQDDKEAGRFFRLSAGQGLAPAQVEYGRLQNDDAAERWFRAAADQGDAEGLFELAELLSYRSISELTEVVVYGGDSLDVDKPCFKDPADGRAAGCDAHKAKWRALEREAVGYFKKALKAFGDRAHNGDVYAQRRLGDVQYHNVVVPNDKPAAFQSYQSAAANGDLRAKFMAAIMQEIGDGVVKNEAEAARLYQEYAAKKLPVPSYRANGDDLLREEARSLTKLMAAVIQEKGVGVAKNEAKAARLYSELGDTGHAYAQTRLAHMTELGLGGLAADRAAAVKLYKAAAAQGVEDAKAALKRLGE